MRKKIAVFAKDDMKALTNILLAIGGIVLVGGCIYGGFWLKRTMNYNLYYKDQIVKEIKENVKKECLK